jgi:hypothetical protein
MQAMVELVKVLGQQQGCQGSQRNGDCCCTYRSNHYAGVARSPQGKAGLRAEVHVTAAFIQGAHFLLEGPWEGRMLLQHASPILLPNPCRAAGCVLAQLEFDDTSTVLQAAGSIRAMPAKEHHNRPSIAGVASERERHTDMTAVATKPAPRLPSVCQPHVLQRRDE